ncbi:NADPH-dependent FMN reductase [Corynebacterium halotolerans]|uniref:NADPH-dependent FMN reductase-like domain-containing protein n=1 Tax=Corynebacterium halotolerans YIM 70093 = DSM 44683 TaxID=1121362 RepID=M1NKM1_9CORY|nr:NAD(P)H-dependent oxidoreductase [Corynebacterium halotolerans]AGF71943.1 hypothetical protein A605_04675 [Corynebacterium halotolerans YIM 70093 = DSM 44683]
MKIGIIVGSIRDGRFGEAVGTWVKEAAETRATEGISYELLDLRSFNIPLATSATIPGMADKRYDDENVTAWSRAVDSCDGFVFVTPEYNRGVPGPFKNAYDSIASEWAGKPVAFVGYGATGGIRAVEQWRLVVTNFQMPAVRNQVELSIFADAGENGFAPNERRAEEIDRVLGDLEQLVVQLNK